MSTLWSIHQSHVAKQDILRFGFTSTDAQDVSHVYLKFTAGPNTASLTSPGSPRATLQPWGTIWGIQALGPRVVLRSVMQ